MTTGPVQTQVETILDAADTRLQLEKGFVRNTTVTDTTPSVKNIELLSFANTGAVTVTDFDDGQEGQHLYLFGDSFTTLQHGTNIFNFAGANLLLTANKVYHYIQRRVAGVDLWYQVGV